MSDKNTERISFIIGMIERLRMNGRMMINRPRLSGAIGLGAAIEIGVEELIVEAFSVFWEWDSEV